MRTTLPDPRAAVDPHWLLVDAAEKPLGRVASRVALLLRGKHRPDFAPHMACGASVVVVNAAKVRLTGTKAAKKRRYAHTGRPGSLRSRPYGEILATRPDRLFEEAVAGMLPKNRLGRRLQGRLHVYPGPEHPHGAQRPEPVDL